MLKFLRLVKVAFWSAFLITTTTILATAAVIQSSQTPSWNQITADSNISSDFSDKELKAIRKSRSSAVKVRSMSFNFFAGATTMTGTYFMANGKPYVITASHGIVGPCVLLMISHKDEDYSCKRYVITDHINDYVIIEVEEKISNAKPVRIPEDLPRGSQWKRSYSLLNKIVYTGYPNAIGPLTLRGDVIGYGNNEIIYIFSHAYGGASGSGVFSKEGKYIGYVVAIDVGSTEWGPDVLENIVIVAPALNVDWAAVTN